MSALHASLSKEEGAFPTTETAADTSGTDRNNNNSPTLDQTSHHDMTESAQAPDNNNNNNHHQNVTPLDSFLVGLSPYFWSFLPLSIAQIHQQLVLLGGLHCLVWTDHNGLPYEARPISKCKLVGTIVAVDRKSSTYVIDDGTGVVDCTFWDDDHDDHDGWTLPMSLMDDDENPHNEYRLCIGQLVQVYGRLECAGMETHPSSTMHLYNRTWPVHACLREIHASIIQVLSSSSSSSTHHHEDAERRHWIQVMETQEQLLKSIRQVYYYSTNAENDNDDDIDHNDDDIRTDHLEHIQEGIEHCDSEGFHSGGTFNRNGQQTPHNDHPVVDDDNGDDDLAQESEIHHEDGDNDAQAVCNERQRMVSSLHHNTEMDQTVLYNDEDHSTENQQNDDDDDDDHAEERLSVPRFLDATSHMLALLGPRIAQQIGNLTNLPAASDHAGAWQLYGPKCTCEESVPYKDALLYCHCIATKDPLDLDLVYRDALLSKLLEMEDSFAQTVPDDQLDLAVEPLRFLYSSIVEDAQLQTIARGNTEMVKGAFRALRMDQVIYLLDAASDTYLLLSRKRAIESYLKIQQRQKKSLLVTLADSSISNQEGEETATDRAAVIAPRIPPPVYWSHIPKARIQYVKRLMYQEGLK